MNFATACGLLALLCACSGSRHSAAEAIPSFTLTIAPASLSVPAGGGGNATVTVARSGGFSGAVVLSLEGAPAGVAGSGIVAANAQTGPFTFTIAGDVAPQSLDALKVQGAAGSLTGTGSFRLVIALPLPAGELSPDRVQASGGVQRGGVMENTGIALEPVAVLTARDAAGTLEVRHGFKPDASPN